MQYAELVLTPQLGDRQNEGHPGSRRQIRQKSERSIGHLEFPSITLLVLESPIHEGVT
jgi:hypothetical protein